MRNPIYYLPTLTKEPTRDGKGTIFDFRLDAFTVEPIRGLLVAVPELNKAVRFDHRPAEGEPEKFQRWQLDGVANRMGKEFFGELLDEVLA